MLHNAHTKTKAVIVLSRRVRGSGEMRRQCLLRETQNRSAMAPSKGDQSPFEEPPALRGGAARRCQLAKATGLIFHANISKKHLHFVEICDIIKLTTKSPRIKAQKKAGVASVGTAIPHGPIQR